MIIRDTIVIVIVMIMMMILIRFSDGFGSLWDSSSLGVSEYSHENYRGIMSVFRGKSSIFI